MEKNIILCSIVAIASFISGYIVCKTIWVEPQSELIEAYDEYNKHTEELLDALDSEYDWVDAFDPYDYYESRAKLDSLLYME